MTADLTQRPELKGYFAKGYWQCDCPGYLLRKPDILQCSQCGKSQPNAVPKKPTAKTGTISPPKNEGKRRQMTKTEQEAMRRFCPPDARFEAITFHLACNHRYTPDLCWWDELNVLHCMEVKGSYKLNSYSRSKLAYDQAKVEFPKVAWQWKQRNSDGSWSSL